VEIIGRNGQFYFDGIIVGAQLEGLRAGWVSFDFPGNPNVVARGHMHWDSTYGDDQDWKTAQEFYDFRVKSGMPTYTDFVGGWGPNWKMIFRDGRIYK
jgi:hypothetical protein